MDFKQLDSWVYLYSKFTPEALLFEALGICLLCACYAAFWVVRKRRYGILGPNAPAYAVKSYLNMLIMDAEQMRIQLFGLLAGTGIDPAAIAAIRAAAGTATATAAGAAVVASAPAPAISAEELAANPEFATKLASIETKMAEQAKAMDAIVIEKTRVEKELIELKAAKGAAPDAGAGGGSDDPKLKEKIATLEAKLAEYSVIEDDLANLKRLQQENAQLKAQLAAKGGAVAPAQASPAPAAPEPEAAPPTAAAAEPEPAVEAAPPVAEAAPVEAAPPAASPPAPAEAPVVAPTESPAFEGLVDQVEKSLAPAAPEPPAGATAAPTPAPAPVAAPVTVSPPITAAGGEKSDADLVAEFEKMLNG